MERSKNDYWNYLEHAAWKDHKYIRIENGKYIYPEDLLNKKQRDKSEKVVNRQQKIADKAASISKEVRAKKTNPVPEGMVKRYDLEKEAKKQERTNNRLEKTAQVADKVAKKAQQQKIKANTAIAAYDKAKKQEVKRYTDLFNRSKSLDGKMDDIVTRNDVRVKKEAITEYEKNLNEFKKYKKQLDDVYGVKNGNTKNMSGAAKTRYEKTVNNIEYMERKLAQYKKKAGLDMQERPTKEEARSGLIDMMKSKKR